jgi:hypothetical protein
MVISLALMAMNLVWGYPLSLLNTLLILHMGEFELVEDVSNFIELIPSFKTLRKLL